MRSSVTAECSTSGSSTMIEDEADVFEITDFTTASEWERFIARFEEVIHEWKLTNIVQKPPLAKAELTLGSWSEKTENLQFADFNFTVTHHFLNQEAEEAETAPEEGGEKTDGTDEHDDRGGEREQPEADTEPDDDLQPVAWGDIMSSENDFPGRAHCLCRWYGLRDFIVMAPASSMDDILSESRAKLLLSSVAIAQHNTTCSVPVFVQVHQKWRRLFFGHLSCPGFRTSFEMVHLKYVPHQYSHLAGLLDVYKAKLLCPVSPLMPVTVGVRFTYVLHDWISYSWPQQPPDMDSLTANEVGVVEFGDLPFGPCEDPVSELNLSTTWPSLSEEMIVDNDVYSDLDPLQAPHWCVRVRMTENPQCLLGDYLEEFVQLCRRKESTDQLLGKSILDDENDMDVSQALQRLTEPGPYKLPSLGRVVTRATSKLQMKPEEAPIPADLLNEILLMLFPDAKSDAQKISKSMSAASLAGGEGGGGGGEGSDASKENSPPSRGDPQDLEKSMEMFKQFKSAPAGTLSYRLATCMCIVNHSYGGLRAVVHLWQEFVLEMRYRWENNYPVPDLDPGSPNMGCSLLHQKLQMLNCCIERKKAREALASSRGVPRAGASARLDSISSDTADGADDAMKPRGRSGSKPDASVSSDDEFFECEDDNASDVGSDKAASQSGAEPMDVDQSDSKAPSSGSQSETRRRLRERDQSVDVAFADSFTHQPEGRLKPCDDLRLLNVDEALYIPLTQEPAPMTEDMLEEHAEVLAKLGTSPEGATLRARMQSACLLSDMESFRAANPGCILGDFVRWYSPRDWVEEDVVAEDGTVTRKSQLSARMQIPGNMWVEVWQSAKAVPARRQRRLFDDTKEAEKVLHWLAAMKPSDVALRLMPMLAHSAITKLLEQDEGQLPMLKKLMNQITNKATKAMRAPRMEVKRFEDIVRQISMVEIVITRAQSLLAKFNQEKQGLDLSYKDLQQFVSNLLDQPDVNIIGASRSPLGTIIHRLFAASQKSAYLLPEENEAEEEEGDKAASRSVPDFPTPAGKEYILRTLAQCPSPWSRPSPQRMYCVLMKEDFRLAGAFTQDTTFQ